MFLFYFQIHLCKKKRIYLFHTPKREVAGNGVQRPEAHVLKSFWQKDVTIE